MNIDLCTTMEAYTVSPTALGSLQFMLIELFCSSPASLFHSRRL